MSVKIDKFLASIEAGDGGSQCSGKVAEKVPTSAVCRKCFEPG